MIQLRVRTIDGRPNHIVKRTICIFLLIQFFTSLTSGQERLIDSIEQLAQYDTIPFFDVETIPNRHQKLFIPYSFRFFNPSKITAQELLLTQKITLVYSLYPEHNNQYQLPLNRNRIKILLDTFPALASVSARNWRIIAQSEAENQQDAKALFHGFVLEIGNLDDTPNFLDNWELMSMAGQDSTVFKVMSRHPEWQHQLVVADLTSSMAPFVSQLLVWFDLNQRGGQIDHVVFFNDGDRKRNREKEIGKTGGIYQGPAVSLDQLSQLAQQTVSGGFGGDLEENDLEAILEGIASCQDCASIILIADPSAPPRDLVLLEKIDKPVSLILCGSGAIHESYLNIALQTNGSIHTLDQDINRLLELNEGAEIELNGQQFIIKNGIFKPLSKL